MFTESVAMETDSEFGFTSLCLDSSEVPSSQFSHLGLSVPSGTNNIRFLEYSCKFSKLRSYGREFMSKTGKFTIKKVQINEKKVIFCRL